ncbi:MAG: aldo/keto reductase [Sandaracinaceae bacterium]
MEHRTLGRSGFKVPMLALGTGTFGGQGEFFGAFGDVGVQEARRLIDRCLERGVTMFDSADVYSGGRAESILGEALEGKRDRAIISTKATFTMGPGPNDVGSSRYHLIRAVEGALRRLRTDYIDVFQLHGFDATTPVEETLGTLDGLVRSGKIRYLGCSNFSSWHLMKSLAVSDARGYERYVAHQAFYSLIGRDYEWDLMPLGLDQGVSAIVWSPLGWGRLTGKLRRGAPKPEVSRLNTKSVEAAGPPVRDEHLFRVVDALDAVAEETGHSIPQIAIAWLLTRPTVASVVLGARNEKQLDQNLAAADVKLEASHLRALDEASVVTPPYPVWHQLGFTTRNPRPV